MSPGLKSIVTALGPVLKTPIRPFPLIQYCHSSAFGCQCISRRAPGRNVTNAAATVLETVNVLLSAICRSPLLFWRAKGAEPSEKVNGCGGGPVGPGTDAWAAAIKTGRLPFK